MKDWNWGQITLSSSEERKSYCRSTKVSIIPPPCDKSWSPILAHWMVPPGFQIVNSEQVKYRLSTFNAMCCSKDMMRGNYRSTAYRYSSTSLVCIKSDNPWVFIGLCSFTINNSNLFCFVMFSVWIIRYVSFHSIFSIWGNSTLAIWISDDTDFPTINNGQNYQKA